MGQQGDGFDWYSTDAPGRRIRSAAKDRAGLEHYFTVRHAAGESLRLTSFQFNGNAGGYGNLQYTLIRQADDLPPTAYTGKGAAICGPTRSMLGVWSMAKTPTPPPTAPATAAKAFGRPGCRPASSMVGIRACRRRTAWPVAPGRPRERRVTLAGGMEAGRCSKPAIDAARATFDARTPLPRSS